MTSTAAGMTTDPLAERHWICARRLRERRRALGLTQADVVIRMGDRGAILTNRTLSAMENGRGLDLGRLPDLAAALDCTITYLVGLTADPTRWEPDTPLTSRGAPAIDEPAEDEPVRVEPAEDEPVRVEPAEDEPAEDEPVRVERARVEPAEDEPARVERVREEPAAGASTAHRNWILGPDPPSWSRPH